MSQTGSSRVPEPVESSRRDSSEPTPRDRVNKLLRDPKGYFDDARRWAGHKAKDDVQRELKEKEARRERHSTLLEALGFASR